MLHPQDMLATSMDEAFRQGSTILPTDRGRNAIRAICGEIAVLSKIHSSPEVNVKSIVFSPALTSLVSVEFSL